MTEVPNDKHRCCPICEQPLNQDSQFAPFCSKRCKMVDLGQWLNGKYTITRPLEHRDLEEGE